MSSTSLYMDPPSIYMLPLQRGNSFPHTLIYFIFPAICVDLESDNQNETAHAYMHACFPHCLGFR